MIDVEKELNDANAKLPIVIDSTSIPLDMQIRGIALAQKHVSDNVVKDGILYQQYKIEGKNLQVVSVDDVIKAAIVFERYLWGQWSKGIAEHAIDHASSEIADALEKEYREKAKEPEKPNASTPEAKGDLEP